MITLSLASGAGVPGGTVTLALSIASTGGDACTTLDFTFVSSDLTLQSVALGAAGAGKSFSFAGNTVIVGGFDALVIPDGVLLNCTFLIALVPSTGNIPVTLSSISASDADANSLTTSSSGAHVLVPTEAPTTLPPGLTLDGSTGEISGYPTETGTFCTHYRVTDSLGATAEITCCITVTTPSGGCFSPISLLNPPKPTYGAQVCVGDTVVPKSLLP